MGRDHRSAEQKTTDLEWALEQLEEGLAALSRCCRDPADFMWLIAAMIRVGRQKLHDKGL